jgi:hypothetical protein
MKINSPSQHDAAITAAVREGAAALLTTTEA